MCGEVGVGEGIDSTSCLEYDGESDTIYKWDNSHQETEYAESAELRFTYIPSALIAGYYFTKQSLKYCAGAEKNMDTEEKKDIAKDVGKKDMATIRVVELWFRSPVRYGNALECLRERYSVKEVVDILGNVEKIIIEEI